MKIQLNEITIEQICKNYVDNNEEGVLGFDSKLNIRPKYQREFIYDEDKRNAVIKTIKKGFPLNVMYWAKNGNDSYEVLDGQQRTISFCQYVKGDFSLDNRYFFNLTPSEQKQILNYKLMIYFCEGDDNEKLEWFKTINIAGLKLSDQELRNAVYTGPWLAHAKSIFSKNNCAAYLLSSKYVNGVANRQEILETALDWISEGQIETYMAKHQLDPNANELWNYFRNVINWVETTFIDYKKEMKGINWAELFKIYSKKTIDTKKLSEEINTLMEDEDVEAKRGIFVYVLDRNPKHLSLRAFSPKQKREAYQLSKGICKKCNKHFEIDQMEADHATPWSLGGKTILSNCQMLCKECNRRKSNS
jgi:hypothetical protein